MLKVWIFLFSLVIFPLFGVVNGNGDFQIWNREMFKFDLNKSMTIETEGEFRFADNASLLHYVHEQTSFVYRYRDWLVIKPAYRQVWVRNEPTAWHTIFDPLFEIKLRAWFGSNVELTNRYMVQGLFRPHSHNNWQYRVKLRLAYHFKEIRSRLYVDDEFFFLSDRGYTQNRFSIGFHKKFNRRLAANLFFMPRWIEISSQWNINYILGAYLSFQF